MQVHTLWLLLYFSLNDHDVFEIDMDERRVFVSDEICKREKEAAIVTPVKPMDLIAPHLPTSV